MLRGEVDALNHVQSQHVDPVLELCLCWTKVSVETAKMNKKVLSSLGK